MEWSLDRFEDRTAKIWPIEVAGALGTVAMAKAPRSSGLPKKKCVLEVS